jgi:tight adherence protein B
MKSLLLILFFGSFASISFSMLEIFGEYLLRGLHSKSRSFQKKLEREFIKITSRIMVIIITGVIAVTTTFFFLTDMKFSIFILPPILTIGLLLTFKVYVYKRNRKVLHQLPSFLDLTETYSKAGITFSQSLHEITEKVKSPMREEIKIITGNLNIGLSLEESLKSLYERIPAEETLITYLAIINCINNGANIGEMIGKIKHSLMEKQRLEQKMRAQTSQGKLQGIVLTLIPLILLFSLNAVMPGYLHALTSIPVGRFIVVIISVMLILGWAMIYKIIKPEV